MTAPLSFTRPTRRSVATALLIILITAVAVGISAPAGAATTTTEKHQAVVILLGAVNLEDLASAQMPHLMRLLRQRGGIALMNTRTGGPYLPEHGYLTLGSGTRALGSPTSGLAFQSAELYLTEPAAHIYRRNTGHPAPPRGAVSLDFANLLRINSGLDHPVTTGALGQAVRSAGLTTAVLGNADDAQGPSRLAAASFMDERGQVPLAKIGPEVTMTDINFPSGRRTNYASLFDEFTSAYTRADLIVVETGDTFRLNFNQNWVTPEMLRRARLAALSRADDFIGRVARAIDWDTTRLIVTSPFPSIEAIDAYTYLTFAIVAGPGVTPGLLTTPTTRRVGLVTMSDIAPSLTEWLGAPAPAGTTGRPVTSEPFVGSIPFLTKVNRQIVATYVERRPVLQTYVVLQIIIILSSVLALFIVPRGERRPSRWLQRILLGLTAVPLALLLLPAVAASDPTLDSLLIIGVTLALVVLSRVLGRRLPDGFLIVYALTTATLVYDLVTGTLLSRASILGFDPMSGARYYGIGNEFSGVIIGATVIATTALLDRFPGLVPFRFLIVLPPLALVAFLSGAPGFGADFGGLIATTAVLIAAWVGLRKRRTRVRHLVWAAVGGLLVLVGVAFYDSFRPASQASHVGEFVKLVQSGGIAEFFNVVSRKLAMNWRLMRYTPWADGLLTFIVGLGILFYRPVGLLRRIIEKNPYFNKGFWIALVGTVVAFLVNDSGVVEAATLMLYPVALLLAFALEEAHETPEKPNR